METNNVGSKITKDLSNRRGYRNGYKTKQLNTRLSSIMLIIPQTGFYPKILKKSV